MQQNIQKTIELIPVEVLSDIFLKNLNPQQFLIKEMGRLMRLLSQALLKNPMLAEKNPAKFGNKNEDFKLGRMAFNINFGYTKDKLELFDDKTYEYCYWDGNLNDIAEKFLFFSSSSEEFFHVIMQLQILDFDKYDKDTRFKELISEYPFFQYYPDLNQKEKVLNESKRRLEVAENQISNFFQFTNYNHIHKFVIYCNRQIKDINFKIGLHFWIVGPLNNSMNLVNPFFSRNNLNSYSDFLYFRQGLK
jgi:hypothetical protein